MKASLRPFLPTDVPALADIFRAAIVELAEEDYDEDQRGAWASVADDEEAFGKRLADALTILAVIEGEPVGFASLRGNEEIDLLYVLPEVARHGIATLLLDALEKLAAARGATALVANVSETALPLFEGRTYVAQSRNTVMVGGEWLSNTTMRKAVAANASAKGS